MSKRGSTSSPIPTFHPFQQFWISQKHLVDQCACLNLPEKAFCKRAVLSPESCRGCSPALPPNLLSTQSAELPGLQLNSQPINRLLFSCRIMRILRPQGNGSSITNLEVRSKPLHFHSAALLSKQCYVSSYSKGKGSMCARGSIASLPSCSENLTHAHQKGLKSRKLRYFQSC